MRLSGEANLFITSSYTNSVRWVPITLVPPPKKKKTFPEAPPSENGGLLFWVKSQANHSIGSASVRVVQAETIGATKLVGNVGFPEVTRH